MPGISSNDQRRPELVTLTEEEKRKVHAHLRARGWKCATCGSRRTDVGDALYLGFLFLSEDSDAYMVALTCTRPQCSSPRDAIRLHRAQFATG